MANFSHLADLPQTETDYRAVIAKRLKDGELSPERAQKLIARGDPQPENITNLIDDLFHRPYREGRIGVITGFSTEDERNLVESTIDFANAKNASELQAVTNAFATCFNARSANRDEFDDEENWQLLQPAALSDHVEEALKILTGASKDARERLRTDLLFLPPRLPMTMDMGVNSSGRMDMYCSLVDCDLHKILDYALLLLLDPSRDFGRLRRCKYECCNRWFLAWRDDNVYCPTRTGRTCNKSASDRRSSTEKKRRYRAKKRREAQQIRGEKIND